MKRLCIVLVVLLVCIPVMTMPVAAASGNGLLGGLANMFSQLGELIKDWILKGAEFILNGLKTLFIPQEDYFTRILTKVHNAFQAKFGGFLSVMNHLADRFTDLRAYNGELFVVQFPDSHLLGGVKVDLLSGSDGIAQMIRYAFSGFVVICTAIFSYKKVLALINA